MLRLGFFLTAVLLLAEPAAAFHSHARGVGWKKAPRASLFTSGRSGSTRVALAAKKKGFAKPQKQETTSVVSLETVDSTAQESAAQTKGVTSTSTSDLQVGSSSESESMNAGQRALEKMRRERAEQKDQELRKLRELIQTDEQLQEAPAAIPEKVAQRMGKRMLPFVGIPLLGSMGTFVAFWYLRTYKNMDFEPSMVATSTVFFLVVGLLGITYSVMSASWDENREGDLLGADEFQRNLDNVKDGLSRSRDNALLRDRMAGLSDAEIKRALQELEKKEAAESRRTQTLQAKLEEDLE